MSQRLRSEIFSWVGASSIGMIVLLAVCEIGIRLFVPRERWQYEDGSATFQVDSRVGWILKPNLQFVSHTFDSRSHWWTRTNADGLMPETATREKKPGIVRVMIFGDSTVTGMGVPPPAKISAVLETELRARGFSVEVLNAGVDGYSTDQVMLRIEQLVPLYRPDITLYGLCANDFGGNLLHEMFGAQKPYFELGPDGKLKEYPPRSKQEPLPFVSGARRYLFHLATYQMFRPVWMVLRARLGKSSDRMALGEESTVYYDEKALDGLAWPLFDALLSRMRQSAERNGSWFGFYAQPSLYEVWDPTISEIEKRAHVPAGKYDRFALERRLTSEAKKVGAPFIPLIAPFLTQKDRGPFHLIPHDPHNNESGYRIMAETLAAALPQQAGIPLVKTADRSVASPR